MSEVLRDEGIDIGKKVESPINHSSRRVSWFGYRTPQMLDTEIKSSAPQPRKLKTFSMPDKKVEGPSLKPTGISRFRNIVNKVKYQNIWGKCFQEKYSHLVKYFGPVQVDGDRELLTFDVNHFKPDMVPYETLAMRAKAILVRPSWLRSEEDIKYLHRYVVRLNCLKRYSINVRVELSKYLLYEKFEKDRIVLRQGDIGYYFYFILSGSVLIEMEEENEKTGDIIKTVAGELKAGSSFGDVALVSESKRGVTYICHEHSEFLKVEKPNFDDLLKKNHKKELQKCLTQLRKHPLFKLWKESYLQNTVESSRIAEYTHGDVILKDLSKPCETIFCIIHGACLVVQKMKLWERVQRDKEDKLMLPVMPNATRRSTLDGKKFNVAFEEYKYYGSSLYQLVVKWWVIRVLKEGDYFGLGEGRMDMSVIADQKISILLVHKTMFRKYDKGRGLGWLRAEAINWYPSDDESMKSFLEWKWWNQFRRTVCLEVLGERPRKEIRENYYIAQL